VEVSVREASLAMVFLVFCEVALWVFKVNLWFLGYEFARKIHISLEILTKIFGLFINLYLKIASGVPPMRISPLADSREFRQERAKEF